MKRFLLISFVTILTFSDTLGQSVAREWNEVNLNAVRNDFAQPTLTARNLWHVSAAMYDAWAIYDENARPYLTGNQVHNFSSTLDVFFPNDSIEESRNKAISYAVYRVLTSRFKNSPSSVVTKEKLDFLMTKLGYDIDYTSNDYQNGNAAALGNPLVSSFVNVDADCSQSFINESNIGLIHHCPGILGFSTNRLTIFVINEVKK